MPAAWKNSAMSGESGAPPDTAQRSRPPRAAWSFSNTSRSASLRLRASPPVTGRPACSRRLTSRPTSIAQLKMRFLSGEPASTPARIFAYTFSNTRGTLQMKCGRTSLRLSPTLSRFSANAVVSPLYGPRNDSSRANEWASGKNRRCTQPSSEGVAWPLAVMAAM